MDDAIQLNYATETPLPRRSIGYWVLFSLNCITLLVGIWLVIVVYAAIRDHNGWGQFGVWIVGVPAALFQLLICSFSLSAAPRWRDPLLLLAGLSMLLNGGAVVANLCSSQYGGC